MIVYDIETAPRPLDEIRHLLPEFVSPPVPEAFDPASVKLGHLKDQAKIDAKIKEARDKSAKEHAGYGQLCLEKLAAHEQAFLDGAALSATTGQVLAIGLMDDDAMSILTNDNGEKEMIAEFWEVTTNKNETFVGHYSHAFDLPFLIRRSWMLGIDVPPHVLPNKYGGFNAKFIDLIEVWRCGSRGEHIKLDVLARALGFRGKLEGLDGSQFGKLWAEDREQAIEYLKTDLAATWCVATGLGVI